ncbi:hypothetical protein ACFMQL_20290 [Nonomuraea fastidiosa]|uniref:hypothetical protein n=1 Tax=Nonomuraea fastidiosa TaxID=46173 RepID=UPI00366E724F
MTTATATGPYWLVFVNNTAVDPDHPLTWEKAAAEWERAARRALQTGERVELVQVTLDELDLVPPDAGGGR